MILEAAVEAAYDASLHLDITTSEIERILKAAAPHMLAAEYDRGFNDGFDEGHRAGQESTETE